MASNELTPRQIEGIKALQDLRKQGMIDPANEGVLAGLEKQYATQLGIPPDPGKGYGATLWGDMKGAAHGTWDLLKNAATAMAPPMPTSMGGLPDTIAKQVQASHALVDPQIQQWQQGNQYGAMPNQGGARGLGPYQTDPGHRFSNGDLADLHHIAALLPFVGPALGQLTDSADAGHDQEALAHLTSLGIANYGPQILGATGRALGNKLSSTGRGLYNHTVNWKKAEASQPRADSAQQLGWDNKIVPGRSGVAGAQALADVGKQSVEDIVNANPNVPVELADQLRPLLEQRRSALVANAPGLSQPFTDYLKEVLKGNPPNQQPLVNAQAAKQNLNSNIAARKFTPGAQENLTGDPLAMDLLLKGRKDAIERATSGITDPATGMTIKDANNQTSDAITLKDKMDDITRGNPHFMNPDMLDALVGIPMAAMLGMGHGGFLPPHVTATALGVLGARQLLRNPYTSPQIGIGMNKVGQSMANPGTLGLTLQNLPRFLNLKDNDQPQP